MPLSRGRLVVIHVQSQDLRKLFLQLTQFGETGLRVELRRGLRKAGEAGKRSVQKATAWSTRIPRATKVSTSFGAKNAGVTIRVNSRTAPHARPINHAGRDGTFRHPVFGHGPRSDWGWAPQRARPFIPRAVEHSREVEREISKLMDDVARRAGFR